MPLLLHESATSATVGSFKGKLRNYEIKQMWDKEHLKDAT